jgi:16S rRNA (guanine(527)-N(7))-methyltransferase RsmG
VTSNEFRERLLARAENAGVSITADAQRQLEAYFRLLVQWNEKINLTALPLRRPTDQTFDRLLIEPFVAARYVADVARSWFDVGSGGGSPAIPLRIAHPRAKLTMIESKGRKSAFLREAVRALGLAGVCVENQRFEVVADCTEPQTIDLVTVRAVRSDSSLFAGIHRVLSPIGRAFLFHSPVSELNVPSRFALVEIVRLGTSGDARLSILKPVFHVEQSG